MKTNEPLPRLRTSASTSRLLRVAIESSDDEPSSSELHALAAGLGLGLVPLSLHATASASVMSRVLALAKSQLVSAIVGPLLIGASAATVLVEVAEPRHRTSSQAPPAARTQGLSGHPSDRPRQLPATPMLAPEPSSLADTARPTAASPPSLPAKDRGRAAASETLESPRQRAERAPVIAESEVALLERAKALVDSEPHAALALANEHASRFPQGVLGQEAEVIAIEALVQDGQRAAALDRLENFRRRFLNSVYLPHLESVVRRPE